MSNLQDYIIIYGDQSSITDINKVVGINKIIADLYPKYIIGAGDHQYINDLTTKAVCNGVDRWSVVNKIFASPGNHDNDQADDRASFNAFFGGAGYRKITIGYIDFFLYDVYLKEAGGYYTADEVATLSVANFQTTTQGQWLIAQLAASTNKWKIVVFHQNCWTSGGNYGGGPVRSAPGMQWDWFSLGVDLVINSHQHYHERMLVNTGTGNVPIICVGGGGAAATTGPVLPAVPIAESLLIISSAATSDFYDVDCANGFINILSATSNQFEFNTYGVNATYIMSDSKDQLVLNK